jgi:hypothetical protein
MAQTNRAPKSSRKSRRPRINASISSDWLIYETSTDDWIRLERAIGKQISESLRIKIVQIVQRYFRIQPFEANAPFLDDVLKRLNLIEHAVQQLQFQLDASGNDSVVDIIRAQLDQNLSKHEIETLDEMLRSVLSSAHHAGIAFKEQAQAGFAEGDAWHEMVSSLKILMRSHSMPYGASQDGSKTKNSKGSPFVQFVKSLQETLPEQLRRHHLSGPFALAKEINRAGRVAPKKGHKSQLA